MALIREHTAMQIAQAPRRRSLVYVLYGFLIFILWLLIFAGLLYARSRQLAAIYAHIVEHAETQYVHTTSNHAELPSLEHIAPCTKGAIPPPAIAARSAVLIDAHSGDLLFEKNPNQSIPPASLTKLVAIYTAMQAIEKGEIHLTDLVTPPPASWASNIPPGSSLMFLGKDQQLTVEELLLGMSVVSGNDAAIALAIHTAGSVQAFVKRMNTIVQEMGLTDTYFAEPSGLDEHNRTTARDFARFSYKYIQKYPENLQKFHAILHFSYPKPTNLLQPQSAQPAIHQYATNTLLERLPGCDGIKTGFIDESGFNISLTAQRNGIRFIAVILGGHGKTAQQGKMIRNQNGTSLLEWAFSTFSTASLEAIPIAFPSIPVLGGNKAGSSFAITPLIALPPTDTAAFTVLKESTARKAPVGTIKPRIILPLYLAAPVSAGEKIGRIELMQKHGAQEYCVAVFPLIANTSIQQGNSLYWKFDHLAFLLAKKLHMIKGAL
ncbi:MAG: D-alanyl-D-alanine carboxypeptidase family protein [Treponema sp.]